MQRVCFRTKIVGKRYNPLGSAITASNFKTGNTGSHRFPQPFPSKIRAAKGHARAEQRQRSGDRPNFQNRPIPNSFRALREPPLYLMFEETRHHGCILIERFFPRHPGNGSDSNRDPTENSLPKKRIHWHTQDKKVMASWHCQRVLTRFSLHYLGLSEICFEMNVMVDCHCFIENGYFEGVDGIPFIPHFRTDPSKLWQQKSSHPQIIASSGSLCAAAKTAATKVIP